MKKAVFFHHVSNMGGGTISLVDVCNMLSSEYDITVIIPKKNSEVLTTFLSRYAKVIHFDARIPEFSYYVGSNPIISRGFFRSFFVSKKEINTLIELIKSQNPDIIIANSIVQLRMGKYLKKLSAKKIMYIRETFRENFIAKGMIRFINKYFDGVMCIAPYEKRYANFEIPCEVVGDCVCDDFDDSENVIEYGKPFNVLYTGGCSPLKGFNTMLEAVAKTNNENIGFVFAGNTQPNMKETLKNVIFNRKALNYQKKSLELMKKNDGKIEYIGYVDRIGMAMHNADVVVFPSSEPHQPRPAIEAGQYGAAVIISDFKQTEDYFKNGYNCLTFEHNNALDLAEKIQTLYNDRELLKKLSENNKNMNEQYHNFEKERRKLLNFLRTF